MSDTNPDHWMTDEASIGHVAANASDRKLAMHACLLAWNTQDIGTLTRVDSNEPAWHGWTLKLWKSE
jgi:hypothetical protein